MVISGHFQEEEKPQLSVCGCKHNFRKINTHLVFLRGQQAAQHTINTPHSDVAAHTYENADERKISFDQLLCYYYSILFDGADAYEKTFIQMIKLQKLRKKRYAAAVSSSSSNSSYIQQYLRELLLLIPTETSTLT